eukprot:CAMPEP_0206565356 /NCGR_PEP_ID=MMETSP0325_2-20121206/24024_1 /ASSEMBLY_ACC=CAM_ASM_000347 /TAXON_ID=2866 /ORGANISM="Crypthecodinium cohnii, Strain Seligo" /LENGTH=599 /DNA_ID=CAMNT_0054068199 /DNA_START=35 /DNA_END=1830 /DNA_ORIENTATION=+
MASASVSATASIREESATAALRKALEEVSEACADAKKFENEMEVVFESLRRAVLDAGRAEIFSGDDGTSNRQIEEFWLFLFAVRKRHSRSRRKRIAECVEVVCRSKRWASVVTSSAEVRAALDAAPELQAEFLAMLPSASPGPWQQPSGTNPWATAVQQGGPQMGAIVPPGSPGSTLDPWGRPDSVASATPSASQPASPWSSPVPPNAWPRGAPVPAPGPFQQQQHQQQQQQQQQYHQQRPQLQPPPAQQQQLGGAPVDPWGNVKGSTPTPGAVPSFPVRTSTSSSSAAPVQGSPWETQQQQQQDRSFSEKAKEGFHNAADRTRQFEQQHQIKARVAEAGRNTVQAAKDTNEKHNISGRVAHGASVAAHKSADLTKKGYHAAKETNEKHDITGKIAAGASSAASSASRGFASLKAAAMGGSQSGQSGYDEARFQSQAGQRPTQPAQQQQQQQQQQQGSMQMGYSASSSNPFESPKPSGGAPQGFKAPPMPQMPQMPQVSRQSMSSQPSNPFSSPVATDAAGKTGGGAASFGDRLNAQTDQFQKKVARNAMNSAASQYTGGAVKKVPDGASDAALDYAKKNPQQAAKIASSAARFAGRVA